MVLVSVLEALWRMLEPRRRLIFSVLVALQFLTGLFEMTGMLFILGYIRGLGKSGHSGVVGKALDFSLGREPSDWEFASYGGLLVISVILLKNLQGAFVRFHVARFLSNLSHRIAMQLFGAFVVLPYEHMVKKGESALQSQLSHTLKVFAVCFGATTQVLSDAAMLIMVLGLLLFVDWRLTILSAVLFGALGVLVYQSLQGRLRRMGRTARSARKTLKKSLGDGFGGLIEARLRNSANYFQSRYAKALWQMTRVERRQQSLGRIPGSANEVLLTVTIVAAVLYLMRSGRPLTEALPILAIFGFAGMRTNSAMSRINRSFQTMRQWNEEFEGAIEEVSRLAPKVIGSSDVTVPTYLEDERPLPEGRDGRMHRHLELRDVRFTYPGATEPAIDGVSFTIERGQFVSFCGESGGGKSTLVMLLLGLLHPTEGQVLCDDWSIWEHIRAWHTRVGYVGQSAYISPASVRENVAFGTPREAIDDAKVWAALELAAAREFVEALPEGLDTILRGRSARLSGGQRQRIVIARALYDDPDLVVFDEATAALDNVTEQAITEAALRLSRKKTVICVAHRLTTIKDSDTIHVVQGGRIVASGAYDDLLRSSDVFRQLARAELD